MNASNNGSKIELSYLTKQLCIILKMSRSQFAEIDPDLLQSLTVRVKKKLDHETSAGRIERYMLPTETLIRAWPLLKKKLSEIDGSDQVAIRIAFGVKKFDHVRISSPDFEDSYCSITIDATAEEIRQWNIVALSSYVKDFVQRKGWSEGAPDRKSLKQACDHAIEHPGEPIQILVNEDEDDLDIIKILSKSKKTEANSPEPAGIPFDEIYNGKGLLQLKADPDGLAARITKFDMRWYGSPSFEVNESWLRKELRRLGIKELTNDFLQRISQKMERRQDLNGLQVASGIAPIPGRSPYLAASSDKKQGDVASLVSCEKGKIVAEIRYKIPATPGTDVYGKPIHPGIGEHFEVEVGEGVERVESIFFRATQDGLLKIKDNQISILKTYVCEGDFNGNNSALDFRGNIIITGNVEAGAAVTASGDISVEGSVRGASIFCGGNLTVKGGLSTSEHSVIRCDGNLKAGFIERAKVICKNNIIVETAVLQSEIYCGGDLTTTASDGRVGASKLYIWGNLSVPKLGFAMGAPTYIHMGEDWKEAKRATTLQSRLNRLVERLEKDLSEERTLKQMKPAQMTKKRLEQKRHLERHIRRLDVITKVLEQKVGDLRAVRKFNTAAKLKTDYVTEGDIEVTLAGAPYTAAPAA